LQRDVASLHKALKPWQRFITLLRAPKSFLVYFQALPAKALCSLQVQNGEFPPPARALWKWLIYHNAGKEREKATETLPSRGPHSQLRFRREGKHKEPRDPPAWLSAGPQHIKLKWASFCLWLFL